MCEKSLLNRFNEVVSRIHDFTLLSDDFEPDKFQRLMTYTVGVWFDYCDKVSAEFWRGKIVSGIQCENFACRVKEEITKGKPFLLCCESNGGCYQWLSNVMGKSAAIKRFTPYSENKTWFFCFIVTPYNN